MQKISPYIEKKYALKAKEAFYSGDKTKCAKILLEKYYDRVYKHRGNYDATIKFKNIKYRKIMNVYANSILRQNLFLKIHVFLLSFFVLILYRIVVNLCALLLR